VPIGTQALTFGPPISPVTNAPLAGLNRYGGVQPNNWNFAPRVGLAYRVNDRTAVRARLWHELLEWSAAVRRQLPDPVRNNDGKWPSPADLAWQDPFRVSRAQLWRRRRLTGHCSIVRREMRTPYVQFYNFTVQHDMTHGILADVSYVGNLGRELPYTLNTNAALPGAGTAGQPLAAFGAYRGYIPPWNRLQQQLQLAPDQT